MAISKRRFQFRLLGVLIFTMVISIPVSMAIKINTALSQEERLIERLQLLHPNAKSIDTQRDSFGLLEQFGLYPYKIEKDWDQYGDWDQHGHFAWDKYLTRVRYLYVSATEFHPDAWEIVEQFPRLKQVLIWGSPDHGLDLDSIRRRLPNVQVVILEQDIEALNKSQPAF